MEPDEGLMTEDDARAAIQASLARMGITFDELAEQAANRRFDSEQARLAWVGIQDIGHLI